MDIDRRQVLAGSFCLALESWTGGSVVDLRPGTVASSETTPWHFLTRSLLDRAMRASAADGRSNMANVERLIRDIAQARDRPNPPVIKWLANPFEAFACLSGFGLVALLQIEETHLWHRADPQMHADEDRLNSVASLGSRIASLVRSAEHDRALMIPKLVSKARAMADNASIDEVFKVRAVAAQIGWLETCVPAAAVQAVTNIELLLSLGANEESIHHQLRAFEAYELGLLATWETADAIICVPRIARRDGWS